MLRALKYEDDFVRLLCFIVWLLWRTSGLFKWAWIAPDRRVWFRVSGWPADCRRRSREEESIKARSKESSHGCNWELVAPYSTLPVFSQISSSFSVCLQVMSKRFREFPEMKMSRLAWRPTNSWGASHSCYQEPATVSGGGGAAWGPWGCPQSRSEPGIVGAGVW